MERRAILQAARAGMVVGAAGFFSAGKLFASSLGQVGRIIDVRQSGADANGRADCSAIVQQAVDTLRVTGGTIYFPAGTYRFDRTVLWSNEDDARRPGIHFSGDGIGTSILVNALSSGPILKVHGVRTSAPVNTTFLWGGGLHDLTIRGTGSGMQHGLEVVGWYYGEISNCQFDGLTGDGLRAAVDLSVEPNPDFSASTLFIKGVWFQRLGGFGFVDLSDVQGAPGYSWDRCVFNMCRKGGALVRSGGHTFSKCSFALCGWRSEHDKPAASAYGLYFDGATTTSSQHFVEGCEFDENFTAHIGARFLSASSFLDNRFIFDDSFGHGRTFPEVGAEIGSGDANASVRGIQFRQTFLRFDNGGAAIGFDFKNYANVRDVLIAGSIFSIPAGGKGVRYRGADPGGRGASFGFRVEDLAPA